MTASDHTSSSKRSSMAILKFVFWVALVGFLSWDWLASPTVDLRNEPPSDSGGIGPSPNGRALFNGKVNLVFFPRSILLQWWHAPKQGQHTL